MQRKEICEIKDTIIEFARDFEKKRGKVSAHLGRSQIIDELYRREHSSRFMNKALKELLKEGYLKRIPAKMNETVYAAAAKQYRSKTHCLTETLTKMGVYSRAVAKHKPYPETPRYDLEE
ncbi:MAG: hypothetical protein GTO55_00775 [Armatimonadetes bacterium]|nr:hypothetical protein [Armatimonadota bacterium]NIM66685.1 hypothetical protein [Armatimonadota bacterium]NIM75242.1 hypothetical protein [Armatimonadota bacterium]NIO75318.1 hypothetical protein [Armatimonadota bacterium]